jgi:hypothetical protein
MIEPAAAERASPGDLCVRPCPIRDYWSELKLARCNYHGVTFEGTD